MRVLFIFPHPDDESFGPAGAIHHLAAEGHEVHLLTLTRGGATKERHRLGLTVEEMGLVRVEEMQAVAKVLKLSSMEVLDLPDSGLLEMDPREINDAIRPHIGRVSPHVVVTYPVGGISGFPDHLVCHAVVKQLYVELRSQGADFPRRLAFFAIDERVVNVPKDSRFRIAVSPPELVDCHVPVNEQDMAACHAALDCYVSYQAVIEASRVRDSLARVVAFEFFQEDFTPPTPDLFDGLH